MNDKWKIVRNSAQRATMLKKIFHTQAFVCFSKPKPRRTFPPTSKRARERRNWDPTRVGVFHCLHNCQVHDCRICVCASVKDVILMLCRRLLCIILVLLRTSSGSAPMMECQKLCWVEMRRNYKKASNKVRTNDRLHLTNRWASQNWSRLKPEHDNNTEERLRSRSKF